ncbi:Crp/Fnr family transcriptional regulator [Roseivirga sp. BDSF3-8]|uniref:Crp/Fnr family transcriptional regulator n=1 Tax=Roseivirga sp. BDSF3-8 TaxID=3241598 RepID=UPI0035319F99
MQELTHHLQSYLGIPTHLVREVAALFRLQKLSRGDYFIRKGQHTGKLGYIRSGYLRVFDTHGNKEITQWIGYQGYFMTDLHAFVFQKRARWNINALTDTEILVLEEEALREVRQLVPNWNEIEKSFISDCFITLENRVFSHLSLSAEERYLQLFEHNKDLFLHVPLNYIASMLGMSPETFSRIRNKIRT